MQASLDSLSTSVGQLPPSQRFAAWREAFALKIARVDAATPDASRFRAEVRVQALPRLFLCQYDVGPLSLIRNRGLLREGEDGCSLVICAAGVVDAQFDDTQLRLTPGEAALVPHHRAGAISTTAGSKTYWLRFDAADARTFAPSPDDLTLKKARSEDPAAALAGLYCEQILARGEPLSVSLASLTSSHLRELTAHLLNPKSELARSAPFGAIRAARLEAVLRFIAANLRAPWLSAASAGRRLGLSGRYVQQLMDGAGLSFSRYVRDLRLDEARRLLQSPQSGHLRITEIAYASGFEDLSHFNREFRRRFGETPTGARKRN
ncbi:MAG TPA: AraC family transcriptional regulator [Rhizomicrobium sp.]|nr:AraC family transcriptional regulator [Rhizomicrobium sp.]